mgnify:CR=1 FL=1
MVRVLYRLVKKGTDVEAHGKRGKMTCFWKANKVKESAQAATA